MPAQYRCGQYLREEGGEVDGCLCSCNRFKDGALHWSVNSNEFFSFFSRLMIHSFRMIFSWPFSVCVCVCVCVCVGAKV